VLIGVHTLCASIVKPIFLKESPPTPTRPIGLSIWEPFNWPGHLVSLAKYDADFCRKEDVCFITSEPSTPSGSPTDVHVKYFLHHPGSDSACLYSSAVISTAGLCAPFGACPNTNMFQHLFRIEFAYKNHVHIWGISPFEFAQCFGFTDNLTHRLSHPKDKFCLGGAFPSRTSGWIFEQIHTHLTFI
jgi:hypothetical protein